MKLVPKVNKDGLYLEDVLVDDAFSGVVPFYASTSFSQLEGNEQRNMEQSDGDSPDITNETLNEPVPSGYTIGIQVPPGLYHPRFDIQGWLTYVAEYDDKLTQREPTTFWGEGLSDETIRELKQGAVQQLSETDQLKQRISDLEVTLTQFMLGNTEK